MIQFKDKLSKTNHQKHYSIDYKRLSGTSRISHLHNDSKHLTISRESQFHNNNTIIKSPQKSLKKQKPLKNTSIQSKKKNTSAISKQYQFFLKDQKENSLKRRNNSLLDKKNYSTKINKNPTIRHNRFPSENDKTLKNKKNSNDEQHSFFINNIGKQINNVFNISNFVPKRKTSKKDIVASNISITSKTKNQYLTKAKKKFDNNEFEEAIQLFNQHYESNRECIQALYYIAISNLCLLNYQQAITYFENYLQHAQNQAVQSNVYWLYGTALKKNKQYNLAIQQFGNMLKHQPSHYDSLIQRGKLYLKTNDIEKAIFEFDCAISTYPNKSEAYIAKADTLKQGLKIQDSLQLYDVALEKINVFSQDQELHQQVLFKKTLLYIETQQFNLGIEILDNILSKDSLNSQALYLKGNIFSIQKNYQKANLIFEQCIKINNDQKSVTRALYEIAKIKILQNDYYQAYYTLTRQDYLDVDKKYLQYIFKFTDAVTFLMKRKFKEAIKILDILIGMIDQVNDFLKKYLYPYRSYGYFCEGNHQLALKDLEVSEKIFGELEKQNYYNKYCCQGILEESLNQKLQFFNKSQKLYPTKMEPYFYKALVLIQFQYKMVEDKESKQDYIKEAFKNLQKAYQINPCSIISYYLSLLYLYKKQYQKALDLINQAIEKAEDHYKQFYYLRGIILSQQQEIKEALNDFIITNNIDKHYEDGYLAQSKCYAKLGDSEQALNNYELYLKTQEAKGFQNITDFYVYQTFADLFFNVSDFTNALSYYEQAYNVNKQMNPLIQKLKLRICQKDLSQAVSEMDFIIQNYQLKEIQYDKTCLQNLKLMSQNQSLNLAEVIEKFKQLTKQKGGEVFQKGDITFYMGVCYFYLGDYDDYFQQMEYSLYEKENESKNDFDYVEIHSEDFRNKTYNFYEFQINCFIVQIFNEQYEQALLGFEGIIDRIQSRSIQEQVKILMQILEDERAYQVNLKGQRSLEIQGEFDFLPYQNRLCSIFQHKKAPFKLYDISLRLYFCLPQIFPPDITPVFNETIFKEVSISQVENRPEAPWIKRNQQAIVFTDKIEQFDELQLTSDSNEQSQKQINNNANSEILEGNFQIDPKYVREQLQLDYGVALQLEKITQKHKA